VVVDLGQRSKPFDGRNIAAVNRIRDDNVKAIKFTLKMNDSLRIYYTMFLTLKYLIKYSAIFFTTSLSFFLFRSHWAVCSTEHQIRPPTRLSKILKFSIHCRIIFRHYIAQASDRIFKMALDLHSFGKNMHFDNILITNFDALIIIYS